MLLLAPRTLALWFAALSVCVGCSGSQESALPARLRVRCVASLAGPARELADAFTAETGIALELEARGSIDLAGELGTAHEGDLYLFDDEELAFAAHREGTVREWMHLATLRPVLATRAGNPAGISELADIARADLRVGIPDPKRCGLGVHVRTSARFIGLWHQTQENAQLVAATEAELATALLADEIDVAVLWDATTTREAGLLRVEELKLEGHARRLTLAVTTGAAHVADALCFARWLRSDDRGSPTWRAAGVACIPGGDPFVQRPHLRVHASERLRAAAEPSLLEWARREGADLELHWAADASLAARANDEAPQGLLLFDERLFDAAGPAYIDRERISSDPLSLVVYGMNPEGVRSLADLAFDGLRVGLLSRDDSALGALLWAALDEAGVAQALENSPTLRTGPDPTPLVEAVRSRELDVALVYGTQAGPPTMRNDVNKLEHPRFELHQAFALRANQDHPELARRMRDSMRNPETNERFFHLGYRWHPRGNEPAQD